MWAVVREPEFGCCGGELGENGDGESGGGIGSFGALGWKLVVVMSCTGGVEQRRVQTGLGRCRYVGLIYVC